MSPTRQSHRLSHRLRRLLPLGLAMMLTTASCGLRTVPPIRYLPILGKEKDVTTTDVLVRALRDRDVAVRAEAVKLLGLLATSPDRSTRQGVARVLGSTLRDRDPGLRLQAVEELGKMDQSLANKYLRSALQDPNPFVRGMVLKVVQAREAERLKPQAPAQAAQAPAP